MSSRTPWAAPVASVLGEGRMMAHLFITWMLVLGFDSLNTQLQRRFGLRRGVGA